MFAFRKYLALVALITTFTTGAAAHTWVEEYQVISDNGTYTGAVGYTRGYLPRTDSTFNGFSMLWLLPDSTARNNDSTTRTRINSTDFVCPPQQRTSNYTATYPKLQVSPGDYVAMKYLENGHTTLPWNITGKPAAGGTVFVFGTTQPSDTEAIADVMEWNRNGDGGNKRGFLLTAQNFDDGRCHQVNCGSISQQRQMLTPNHVAGQNTSSVESWCESDVKIPESAAVGTLAIYWIWQWPTAPNVDCNAPAGKDEYYTSCADFDVVAAGSVKNAAAVVASDAPAPTQSIAVSDWKSRTAHTTSPSVNLADNDKVARSVALVQTSFASACSVQASIISANNLGVWPEVYVPNTCSVVTSFGTAAASAAAADFGKAASSYSAGSKDAWKAAFSKAGIPIQTPVPWSAAFSTGSAAPAPSSPSAYTPAETATSMSPLPSSPASAPSALPTSASPPSSASVPSVSPTMMPPYPISNGTEAQGIATSWTTLVVVITSTLPPGVPIPTISTVGRSHARSF